jgi:hypothetical protein
MTTARLHDAARRALTALDDLIYNTTDPGVEALGARHELAQTLLGACADRPAVLREAAEVAESLRQFEPATGARKAAQVSENVGVLRVADELRRMADEEQPTGPASVLSEVAAERVRQDAKWGEQNHPDGTGMNYQRALAEEERRTCQAAFRNGRGTWRHVLAEEFFEAMAEKDPAALRAELVQVAAVAAAWIEAIDRRQAALPRMLGHATVEETTNAYEAPAEQAKCAKCQHPFDPSDTRFDGHGQHAQTPFCRRCVDRCHDTEIADHRCAVCR